MDSYEIVEYVSPEGRVPFAEWFFNLKDAKTQSQILLRIRRASLGNFGDAKAIKGTKGLFEMREHRGPGFRLFYGLEGKRVVLLLVGSAKKDQAAAIAKATRYLADYRERKKK